MSLIAGMFLVGLAATVYLIYRLVRYSPWWRHQPIGRSFMATKLVLLAVFVMAILGNLAPDWEWRDELRFFLTILADIAIVYATVVVVRLQRETDRRVPPEQSRMAKD